MSDTDKIDAPESESDDSWKETGSLEYESEA